MLSMKATRNSTSPSSGSVSGPSSFPSIRSIRTPRCTPLPAQRKAELGAASVRRREALHATTSELLQGPERRRGPHQHAHPRPCLASPSPPSRPASTWPAPCPWPRASTTASKIVEPQTKTGLKYMMMETVVYTREYLFVKELVRQGRAGQVAVPAGQPPAGHGRLARLLARPAADAVCHALRRPVPGLIRASHGRVCVAASAPARSATSLSSKYGSPFAVETAHIKIQDSDLCAAIYRSPVRHRPPVSRELRRLRVEGESSSGR